MTPPGPSVWMWETDVGRGEPLDLLTKGTHPPSPWKRFLYPDSVRGPHLGVSGGVGE